MPKSRKKIATLKNIAEESQVSITTVSRILRNERMETFTPETIERVQSTAKKLKYRPNLLISGMQQKGTKTIGVIIPTHGNYYRFVNAGIHDALIAQNYLPYVVWPRSQGYNYAPGMEETDLIHALVDRRVEGIILKPSTENISDEYLHEIFDRDIPLVVVDRELPNVQSDFVGSDNPQGAQLALQHLYQLGHRRIGYFGVQGSVKAGEIRHRYFQEFIKKHPDTQASEALHHNWAPTPETALPLLQSSNRPSAVFCANDDFAYQLIKAAQSLGIRVPQDLSLIGFGHISSPFSDWDLSSIDQSPYQMGQQAAQRMLERINNPIKRSQSQYTLLPPRLHIGNTTIAYHNKQEV